MSKYEIQIAMATHYVESVTFLDRRECIIVSQII